MSDHHRIFTLFFLDPEVILSSHTMFINDTTKEFISQIHLLTFSISLSRIRMKFYFVFGLIRLSMYVYCMNELIVNYKVATCHYSELCHV